MFHDIIAHRLESFIFQEIAANADEAQRIAGNAIEFRRQSLCMHQRRQRQQSKESRTKHGSISWGVNSFKFQVPSSKFRTDTIHRLEKAGGL